ncbi:WAS/WASL-interacting protein family member 2-like [Harpegnathos saltator]|uniref:WAS/WASL-interacting protein family member 2-like n=1 Tax=Harpegnathos saltator TaxID=610380 RepID=UPI000DBEEE30|nr:WAS/WASL-interacting protein family member 2-like [Harpegnathos saltator]
MELGDYKTELYRRDPSTEEDARQVWDRLSRIPEAIAREKLPEPIEEKTSTSPPNLQGPPLPTKQEPPGVVGLADRGTRKPAANTSGRLQRSDHVIRRKWAGLMAPPPPCPGRGPYRRPVKQPIRPAPSGLITTTTEGPTDQAEERPPTPAAVTVRTQPAEEKTTPTGPRVREIITPAVRVILQRTPEPNTGLPPPPATEETEPPREVTPSLPPILPPVFGPEPPPPVAIVLQNGETRSPMGFCTSLRNVQASFRQRLANDVQNPIGDLYVVHIG